MRRPAVVNSGLGEAPAKPLLTEHDLASALTYYNRTGNYDWKWAILFAEAHGSFDPQDIAIITASKKHITNSTLAMCKLWLDNLIPMSSVYETRLLSAIRLLIETQRKTVASDEKTDVSYKKDSLLDRYIADVESVVDLLGYANIPLRITIDLSRLSNADRGKLRGFYEPKLNEIRAVVNGTDSELVEAYASSKANLTRIGEFYASILETDFHVRGVKPQTAAVEVKTKRTFKTRKPRAPSFKKLRFLRENDELGLKSVEPMKVHASTTLVTYNAKYGSVSVYQANEGKTLAFKRTSLTNFDESKSFTKRASRAKALVGVLKGGNKSAIIKAIQGVNSKPTSATSVMSNDTILVAAF